MATTLNVDMAKWAGTDTTGPITFTYEGSSPADPGPAGAVIRMMIAQVTNDSEAMKEAVTAGTLEMGKPALPGKTTTANLGAVTYEGETAVVPGKLNADGTDQEVTFLVVKEEGTWKVDMRATIERLMGGSMEQLTALMEQGMKTMADSMSAAMGGLGEGMNEAFGGRGEKGAGEGGQVKPKGHHEN